LNHFLYFFFFSSRRRHTRSDRDWSSDVCSSDLFASHRPDDARCDQVRHLEQPWQNVRRARRERDEVALETVDAKADHRGRIGKRSEERRVGKECRCRGGGGQEKKEQKM